MRTVEILKNNKWTEIKFENIKTGDIIRMFEEDGEPVLVEEEDGSAYFECRAISDAFENEDGILTVSVEANREDIE